MSEETAARLRHVDVGEVLALPTDAPDGIIAYGSAAQ
ncbi:MAG: hypothetical protein ACI9SB_001002 [Candidatus Azotimanducaceae bacterium]|jgi:hypothetical protein